MGYYPKFDKVGMRVLEGISSFPELLFALVLASILGPGVDKIIIALAIVSTPAVARIVRSQVLSLKQENSSRPWRPAPSAFESLLHSSLVRRL